LLSVEHRDPSRSDPCSHCGGITVSLTPLVSKDENAHAVVYFRFGTTHPDPLVRATVSLGEWWLDSAPSRVAFALEITAIPAD
jgi:hypothetical protein